ncbi:putative iS3 orfB [Escherichia coli 1-176-05_S4_C1]|nr:putative iS3 orfB [Escherichia coli 1-176-05_S4_C1]
MKYVFIEKHQAEFSIKAMSVCSVWPAAAGIRGVSGGQG